jgi:hypothetical protein
VAQTNAGSRQAATARQNELLGIAVGEHEAKIGAAMGKRASKEAARKKTPPCKLSRQRARMIRKSQVWREAGSGDYATGQELDDVVPEPITPTDKIPAKDISSLPLEGVAIMIDLEHGGTAKGGSIADYHMLQLAMLLFKYKISGKKLTSTPLGKYSTYVHSTKAISPVLQAKLGIKPASHPHSVLRHAPKPRAVFEKVATLVAENRAKAGQKLPVVAMAHNGFACDAPVLYWNLQRVGFDSYGWFKKVGIDIWFDSLLFARLVRGEKGGNSVKELYESEVDRTGGGLTFHDALDDCTATWDFLTTPKFAARMTDVACVRKSVLSTESLVAQVRKAKEQKAAKASQSSTGTKRPRGPSICSICGQSGHNKNNKRKCPGPLRP